MSLVENNNKFSLKCSYNIHVQECFTIVHNSNNCFIWAIELCYRYSRYFNTCINKNFSIHLIRQFLHYKNYPKNINYLYHLIYCFILFFHSYTCLNMPVPEQFPTDTAFCWLVKRVHHIIDPLWGRRIFSVKRKGMIISHTMH